jgi:hypothetical protein
MVKETKNLVEKFLIDKPHLRDDDNKLLANIYWSSVHETMHYLTREELAGVKLFLKKLAEGGMPNFESVRRCRQKLQEENPELRGEVYEQRHKMEAKVREDIINWSESRQHKLFDE